MPRRCNGRQAIEVEKTTFKAKNRMLLDPLQLASAVMFTFVWLLVSDITVRKRTR
jgi:hypothetical protein